MAFHSAAYTDNLIWRAPLPMPERPLTQALRERIASHSPHLLDVIQLDDIPPHQAMTLTQWQRVSQLSSLLAAYSDHIYRHHPTQPRENKPLISLWAQWYIGLLVPPLMLALLTEPQAPSLSAEHIHAEFHETGRAARFWIDVQPDNALTALSPQGRLEQLITQVLKPTVSALEATGEINARLIWSNTGYLINWFLGEMKSLLGDAQVEALRQHLFFAKQFSNGLDNPLWRSVVLRDGVLVRRTCCQRYRLPDVQQCGDCTLK